MDELKDDLFHYILELSSGKKKTNNEKFGYREISIFKEGVIL
jgi:altronate hydrolase